jgi:membrane-bound lytic murein transglycosylase D
VANASSPVGAKGLWQFMYGTGKQFDLEINSYVDERFDPIKSTEAACKYLSSLYKTFNDWDLALAAYNSGPGNVAKAIKRAGGKTNYWEIRNYLPQETQGYLPAFYATFYIFEFAKTHQLEPIKSGLSYVEVDTIHVKKQVSFQSIQEKTSISYEVLKSLNPQYKKEIIPQASDKSYVLTLPIEMVHNYINNSSKSPIESITKNSETNPFPIKITAYNSYKVETGDNLSKIAAKHNITLEQLKKWNGLQTDYVIAEQRLVITDKNTVETLDNESISEEKTMPFSPEISPILSSDISVKQDKNTANYFETYTVKEGDTLFKISRKYPEVTINQIREWNNITKVHYLKPGTQLKIF